MQNKTPLNSTIPVDLADEDYKTLIVQRNFWGLFEKVTSTSTIKTKTFQKMALVGTKQLEKKQNSLVFKRKQ